MNCPTCKAEFNNLRGVDINTHTPIPGDILICENCGKAAVAEKDGKCHAMTDAELHSLNEAERNDVMFALRVIAARKRQQRQ